VVFAAYAEVGNKWTEIARRLKGRTDNQVALSYLCMRSYATGVCCLKLLVYEALSYNRPHRPA
jgi:hypothetical protein